MSEMLKNNLMHQEFADKIKNLMSLCRDKPWPEISHIRHELVSEFLNHKDELVEPLSQLLLDPSTDYEALNLAIDMVEMAGEERFVPSLIQLLEEGRDLDDGTRERVSNILWGYGANASAHIVNKLRENFEKKIYNYWLVDALNGGEASEFLRKTIEDFLGNRARYEDWFDVGHFAWKLSELDRQQEIALPLVERLLAEKNLHREDRLELMRLLSFIKDEGKFLEEEDEEEGRKAELLYKLVLTGLLHVRMDELVPDGLRPIIDDSNVKEYLPLLYWIERLIFEYSEKYPSLKDRDVIELLKNVRDGIWKGYEGGNDFERFFITGLKLNLFDLVRLRYTRGEISACLSHVLNSVKRRRKLDGDRGYLDFIRDYFQRMEKLESS